MSIMNWKANPEFFCELKRVFKKSGRKLISGLISDLSPSTCNDQRGKNSNADDDLDSHHDFDTDRFPRYFHIAPSHIRVLEGSLTKKQAGQKDFCGRTPLHYAAMSDRKYAALMRYLGEQHKDVDVNVKDHRGYTPLHYACALGRNDNVSLLLMYGAKLDNQGIDGMYPTHLAAREGHVEVIERIPRTDTYRKLTDAPRRLTDYNGYLPIHWAAINGHVEIVQQLKADVDVASIIEKDTPLLLAVVYGKISVVKALLELSVDMEKTNATGEIPLLLALRMSELEIAMLLIENGANPKRVDRFGDTPLHNLSTLIDPYYMKGKKDISELCKVADTLVEKSADLKATNNEGRTPADHAKLKSF